MSYGACCGTWKARKNITITAVKFKSCYHYKPSIGLLLPQITAIIIYFVGLLSEWKALWNILCCLWVLDY